MLELFAVMWSLPLFSKKSFDFVDEGDKIDRTESIERWLNNKFSFISIRLFEYSWAIHNKFNNSD